MTSFLKMKYFFYILTTFCLILPLPAEAKNGFPMAGLWVTKKQDLVVQIKPCGEDKLCGYITWLSPDESPYSVTGKPLFNTKVLIDFSRDQNNEGLWTGKVYKADDEKTYSGLLKQIGQNNIELRVYIGLPALGKTKTLRRGDIKDYPACKITEKTNIKAQEQDIKARGTNQ